MRAAILCTIDQSKLPLFAAHREAHYAFLLDQRDRIVFGGPLRAAPDGPPETMLMIVEVDSLEEAEAFIKAEPYAQYGGFRDIHIRAWTQVLPELEVGLIERTLAAEREHLAR